MYCYQMLTRCTIGTCSRSRSHSARIRLALVNFFGLAVVWSLVLPTAMAQDPNSKEAEIDKVAIAFGKTNKTSLPMAKRDIAKPPKNEASPFALKPEVESDILTGVAAGPRKVVAMAKRNIAKPPKGLPSNPPADDSAIAKEKPAGVPAASDVATEKIGQAVPLVEAKPIANQVPLSMPAANADPKGKIEIDANTKKLLALEIDFLNRTVALPAEQKNGLAIRLDDAWLVKTLRLSNKRLDVNRQLAEPDQASQHRARRKTLQRAFLKAMEEFLSPEQMLQYRAECKSRDDFQREANVDGIMLLLNERLALQKEQYDAIRGGLLKSYRGEHSIEWYITNRNYLPPLPDSAIVKHLDEPQTQAYQKIPKVDFQEDGADILATDWGAVEW